MEKTDWRLLTDPKYLGEYSLPNGKDLIATIDYARKEEVISTNGKKELKVVAHLKNGMLPFVINKTNMKVLQKLYGRFIEDWHGRSIQIYFDPTVKFGREVTGGLRIRPTIPQQTQVQLTCSDCGNPIKQTEGKTPQQISATTYSKYGKSMCWECAVKEKQKTDARKAPDVFGG